MKPRKRRLLKWVAITLTLATIGCGACVGFLLSTEPGAKLVFWFALPRIPVVVSVGDVNGSLKGPLELADTEVQLDGARVHIDSLSVDLRLIELVSKRLRILTLGADGVHVTLESRAETLPSAPDTSSDSTGSTFEILFDQADIRRLSVVIPDVAEVRNGTVHASGNLNDYVAQAAADLLVPDLENIHVALSGRGTLQGIAVDTLAVVALEGTIEAHGSFAWLPNLNWQLQVDARNVSPTPLIPNGQDWPATIFLRGQTDGAFGDGGVDARVELDTLHGSLRDFLLGGRLSATVQGKDIDISALTVEWGPLRAFIDGQIGEQLALSFDLNVPDLGVVLTDGSGSVSVVGEVQGTSAAPLILADVEANDVHVDRVEVGRAIGQVNLNLAERAHNEAVFTVTDSRVSGRVLDSALVTLRGFRHEHTLTGWLLADEITADVEAAGNLEDEGWAGQIVRLSIGGSDIGNWRLADTVQLRASRSEVDIASACLDGEEGRVCTEASWRTGGDWRAKVSLLQLPLNLAQPFLPEGWALDGPLDADLDLSAAEAGAPKGTVDVYPGRGIIRFPYGDDRDSVAFGRGSVLFSIDRDSLRGEFTIAVAEAVDQPAGTLSGNFTFPSLAVLRDRLEADGAAKTLRRNWTVGLSIDSLPLSFANAFLPEEWTIAGNLDGEIDAATDGAGGLSAQIDMRPGAGMLERKTGSNTRRLHFDWAVLTAQAGNDGTLGQVDLRLLNVDSVLLGNVVGDLRLPYYSNLGDSLNTQTLEGRVEGGLDLSVLPTLIDQLSASEGRLELDMDFGGTLSEPYPTGNLHVRGQTDVPALGIHLSDFDLTASGDREAGFTIAGHVNSGEGQLVFEGRSPLVPSAESPLLVSVEGERFQAAETDQLELEVSPAVQVTMSPGLLDVTGEIAVSRATVALRETSEAVVPVSEDVVFVGPEQTPASRNVDLSARIDLTLGDRVTFDGFGLATRLEGALLVTAEPETPVQATGELVFREGVYRGRGQNLTIDPGRLVFGGPINNPTLDVRTYRLATDGTEAGLLIRGELATPEVEVWSDPAMSESDALGYMVFGRKLDQASEDEQAQLGNAAVVLGANVLTGNLASSVGLDEARIETGSSRDDAAFVAGKYLSPKLYVSYGVGLFEPVNTFRIRYSLTSKLILQTQTGTYNATDILLRIERGR